MALISSCGDQLLRTQHVAAHTQGFVAVNGTIPVGSGPAAPPGGGSGSGTPTRPPSGQLWPRGDGVPRS